MQTFLPYESYMLSAVVLDYRRLGKQRVEAKQILMALQGESKGWVNHPAVKMWQGYEPSLAFYAIAICEEWVRRGYKDNLLPYFRDSYEKLREAGIDNINPHWLGNHEFHQSHKSNLIRKDPAFYIPKFGYIDHDLPYIWNLGKADYEASLIMDNSELVII